MAGRIQSEIKQSKPFGSLEEEAYLNLQRTLAALGAPMAELLRENELTSGQYNVLRILRGAGDRPLNASDIASRMITRDPDVTRLVDRLEQRGLVERWRCGEDRRVVWTRISPAGLELLEKMDQPVDHLHVRLLGHMDRQKLETLVDLLEEARSGA